MASRSADGADRAEHVSTILAFTPAALGAAGFFVLRFCASVSRLSSPAASADSRVAFRVCQLFTRSAPNSQCCQRVVRDALPWHLGCAGTGRSSKAHPVRAGAAKPTGLPQKMAGPPNQRVRVRASPIQLAPPILLRIADDSPRAGSRKGDRRPEGHGGPVRPQGRAGRRRHADLAAESALDPSLSEIHGRPLLVASDRSFDRGTHPVPRIHQ